MAQPDIFERFCRETVAAISPVRSIDVPLLVAPGRLALESLVFERPLAREVLVDETADGSVVVSAAGSELLLEGIGAGLIRRIFDTDAFTLAEALGWDHSASADDIAALIEELVRAGLLTARSGPASTR
jgi:hypothetical protein